MGILVFRSKVMAGFGFVLMESLLFDSNRQRKATMENRICVNRDGGGCKFCRLTARWTKLICAKGRWEGKKSVTICNFDRIDDKTISPRPRKVFKTAERCEYYEAM